jgi:hypothetical protein
VPGQLFIAFCQRKLRLPHPVPLAIQILLLFLGEQMLIGNRYGHLRLYLHELILHIQEKLPEQLLRMFGLTYQVVYIRFQERSYTFE